MFFGLFGPRSGHRPALCFFFPTFSFFITRTHSSEEEFVRGVAFGYCRYSRTFRRAAILFYLRGTLVQPSEEGCTRASSSFVRRRVVRAALRAALSLYTTCRSVLSNDLRPFGLRRWRTPLAARSNVRRSCCATVAKRQPRGARGRQRRPRVCAAEPCCLRQQRRARGTTEGRRRRKGPTNTCR